MRESINQSHLRFPLTRLLGSAGHLRVLRALVRYGGPLGVTQLAADAGMTPRGVRLVLDSLTGQGIVDVFGQSRTQLYNLSLRHPFAEPLHQLFEAERARWDTVQEALKTVLHKQKQVRSAWLYGSVARGEDVPGSDVDIAVVLGAENIEDADRVREALGALGDQLRLDLSVVVLMPRDMTERTGPPSWWASLTRDAKVLKGVAPVRQTVRPEHLAVPA